MSGPIHQVDGRLWFKKGQQIEPKEMPIQTEEEAYQQSLLEIKNLYQGEFEKMKDRAVENIKFSNQRNTSKFVLNNLSIEIEMVRIYRNQKEKLEQIGRGKKLEELISNL